MKLKALVETQESTGYYAEVVRQLDKLKGMWMLTSDDEFIVIQV